MVTLTWFLVIKSLVLFGPCFCFLISKDIQSPFKFNIKDASPTQNNHKDILDRVAELEERLRSIEPSKSTSSKGEPTSNDVSLSQGTKKDEVAQQTELPTQRTEELTSKVSSQEKEKVSQIDVLKRLTELEDRLKSFKSAETSKFTTSKERGSTDMANAQRTKLEQVSQQVKSLTKKTEVLSGMESKLSSLETEVKKIKSLVAPLEQDELTRYSCQGTWTSYGQSCYRVLPSKTTWMGAQQKCKQIGSRLAVIETPDENTFLRGYLNKFGGKDMSSWIGGTDAEVEGTWKWYPSGETMTFFDWGGHDPNQDGNCLLMYRGFDYKWGDKDCSAYRIALCERHLSKDAVTD